MNIFLFYCSQLDGRSIPLEIYLHKDLKHTNIVRLYDFFEYSQAYVMVLERPTHHKDLFDYITERKYLTEQEAREIFQQVVEAALYCESKGVFHRDIKDENLLLDTKTGVVKLIDFGSGSALENVLFTDYEGKNCPFMFKYAIFMAITCRCDLFGDFEGEKIILCRQPTIFLQDLWVQFK